MEQVLPAVLQDMHIWKQNGTLWECAFSHFSRNARPALLNTQRDALATRTHKPKPTNQKNEKNIKKTLKNQKTKKTKKSKQNEKIKKKIKNKNKKTNQKNNSVGLLNLALCGRRVPEYCFFGFFGSLAISLVALLVSRALLPARRASAYGLTIAYFRVVCYFTTCCHVGSTIPLV